MRMRFKGQTSSRPDWWFPIKHGEVYDVVISAVSTANPIYDTVFQAIIMNDRGQKVRCPYASMEAFEANWERAGIWSERALFCPSCGAEVKMQYEYCPYCGKKL